MKTCSRCKQKTEIVHKRKGVVYCLPCMVTAGYRQESYLTKVLYFFNPKKK